MRRVRARVAAEGKTEAAHRNRKVIRGGGMSWMTTKTTEGESDVENAK